MATPQGPTAPTIGGLVDGQSADAADVLTPINELASAVDEARGTVMVSEDDTTKKYLKDGLIAGDGISLTTQNGGANEQVQITCTVVASPVGTLMPYLGGIAPSGWLLCDGSLQAMGTYRELLEILITGATLSSAYGLDVGTTFTGDAATDKLLATAHGLSDGDTVLLTNSGGALSGGLAANTAYYVVNAALNDFQVSLTEGGAVVDITDAGSGTHNFHTQFNVPDLRGRAFAGLDNMGGSSANRVTDSNADSIGGTMGEETHTLTIEETPAHVHTQHKVQNGGPVVQDYGWASSTAFTAATFDSHSSGGGQAHNNMQPTLFGNWIIKA